MTLTALIHRRAVYYFGALLLFTLPAFWPSYFFPPRVEADYHVHFHGIAMFLWVILLVAQAALMRAGARDTHRKLGKLSYALAPAIVVSTLLLMNYRLKSVVNAELLYFLYLQAALIAFFTFCYAQAIRYRHVPAVHARYMIGTAFATFDPIIARVLFVFFGTEPPHMQVATFVMMDALLLVLIARERRREAAPATRVFPLLLGIFLILQVAQFVVPRQAWWAEAARWYGALPLP
jgi:hypothetical protein